MLILVVYVKDRIILYFTMPFYDVLHYKIKGSVYIHICVHMYQIIHKARFLLTLLLSLSDPALPLAVSD